MHLSRLSKGTALIVLAASTWMSVEPSSVSAQASGADAIKMFDQDSDGGINLKEAEVAAAAADETAPPAGTLPLQYAQKDEKPPQYDDCVTACIDRMEVAKAECVARRTTARNYDTNCVMSKEKEVVDCVRACK